MRDTKEQKKSTPHVQPMTSNVLQLPYLYLALTPLERRYIVVGTYTCSSGHYVPAMHLLSIISYQLKQPETYNISS